MRSARVALTVWSAMSFGCVGSAGANLGVHYVPGVGARLQAEPDFDLGFALGSDPAAPDTMVTYGITPGLYYDLDTGNVGGGIRFDLTPSFLVDDYMLGVGPGFGWYTDNRFPQLGLAGQLERAFAFGSTCPGYHLVGLRSSVDAQLDVFGASGEGEGDLGPWDLGFMASYRGMKQFLRSSGFC